MCHLCILCGHEGLPAALAHNPTKPLYWIRWRNLAARLFRTLTLLLSPRHGMRLSAQTIVNNGARELPRTCTSQGLLRPRAKLRCSPRNQGRGSLPPPFASSVLGFQHNSASLMVSTSSILAHITGGRQDHLREIRARAYRHGAVQRQGAGTQGPRKRGKRV